MAILNQEPDALMFAEALVAAPAPVMSSGTYVEAGVVVGQLRNPVRSRQFDDLLRSSYVEVVAFTPDQALIARQAYQDFGRGSGHPARLNFGDCFSYALAKDLNQPLLFKGDDFRHTDIRPAI